MIGRHLELGGQRCGGDPLGAPTFDVWAFSDTVLTRHGAALCRHVSDSERARADRLARPENRWRFLQSRGALRWLLGSYLDMAPEELDFGHTAHGKPFLCIEGSPAPIAFNQSHNADLLAIAISDCGPVGIDIEHIDRHDIERLSGRILSDAEAACYASLKEHERKPVLWRAWTRKEAYLKGVGIGLSEPLPRTTVTIDPHSPARLVASQTRPRDPEFWRLSEFRPAPGVIGAVAIRHEKAEPRFFTADEAAFGDIRG
jgi:4'-phosphopantetheinyl transferase